MSAITFTTEQIHDAMIQAWTTNEGLKTAPLADWSTFLHAVLDNLAEQVQPPDPGAYRSPEKQREQQLAARRAIEASMKAATPVQQPMPIIHQPVHIDLGTPPPSRRRKPQASEE